MGSTPGLSIDSSILAWKIPQKSLVGYSPNGHKELDETERLNIYTHTENELVSIQW